MLISRAVTAIGVEYLFEAARHILVVQLGLAGKRIALSLVLLFSLFVALTQVYYHVSKYQQVPQRTDKRDALCNLADSHDFLWIICRRTLIIQTFALVIQLNLQVAGV